MKILLVGEFSRLHNSLKEGLLQLGHEVDIVGTGDDFKNFPVDFSIAATIVNSSNLISWCNKISRKLFSFDLEQWEKSIRFKKLLPKLIGYDVVQLINSDALEVSPKNAERFFKKLFSQNKKSCLLICGDETPIVDVQLKNKLKYSVLTPLFENSEHKKFYSYTLKFVSKPHRKLFEFLQENCETIIASDLDYVIPLQQTPLKFTHIPNPVNTATLSFETRNLDKKIVIFYGKNKHSFVKKGSVFFEEALKIIASKYGEKVQIRETNSIPYKLFKQYIDEADIVLDQVYAFDQGYNALEAMAKGKVVFTGAESEFYEYYQLQKPVAINALPDVNYLVEQLSRLIDNPEFITEIGTNARDFIEKKHNYVAIAEKYVNVWNTQQ